MKVLVCGGRDYDDVEAFYTAMSDIYIDYGITKVISGHAKGADQLGEMWAAESGIAVEVYPADWKKNGRSAGPIRNTRMLVEGKPDLVVAFAGGKGTANMIKQAKAAGVKTMEIE
jgi:hypothetical protein